MLYKILYICGHTKDNITVARDSGHLITNEVEINPTPCLECSRIDDETLKRGNPFATAPYFVDAIRALQALVDHRNKEWQNAKEKVDQHLIKAFYVKSSNVLDSNLTTKQVGKRLMSVQHLVALAKTPYRPVKEGVEHPNDDNNMEWLGRNIEKSIYDAQDGLNMVRLWLDDAVKLNSFKKLPDARRIIQVMHELITILLTLHTKLTQYHAVLDVFVHNSVLKNRVETSKRRTEPGFVDRVVMWKRKDRPGSIDMGTANRLRKVEEFLANGNARPHKKARRVPRLPKLNMDRIRDYDHRKRSKAPKIKIVRDKGKCPDGEPEVPKTAHLRSKRRRDDDGIIKIHPACRPPPRTHKVNISDRESANLWTRRMSGTSIARTAAEVTKILETWTMKTPFVYQNEFDMFDTQDIPFEDKRGDLPFRRGSFYRSE